MHGGANDPFILLHAGSTEPHGQPARLWWHGWVARLVGAGFAYRDVMDMPWPLARDFSTACAHIARDALLHAAVAARVAQAEGKDWEKWVREVGGEAAR